MTKNFYVACLSLFSLVGLSQTTILLTNYDTSTPLAPNATVYLATQAESNTKVTIDIKNTGTSTQTYTVKRKDLVLNSTATSTASAYFCIAGTCYGAQTTQANDPLVLNSMQSASQLQGAYQMLVADLDEAEAVGYSQVKYQFENVNNPSDLVNLFMEYNSPNSTVGLYELSKNTTALIEVYPNPVINKSVSFKIVSELSFSSSVFVYNSIGIKVAEKELSVNEGVNTFSLDGSVLSGGIYFLSMTSGGSTITKRFIVE